MTIFNVESIYGIADIVAESDAENTINQSMLPVLPHKLLKFNASDFSNTPMNQYTCLLDTGQRANNIGVVDKEHGDLVNAHNSKPAICSSISAVSDGTKFNGDWSVVKGHFQELHHILGGLASVVPVTSQVEGDFSVVKREKDIFHTAITDFFLGGVFHSKQFNKIYVH